jgi:glycosyltransferase involved in cell wall biosynthesis
MRILIRSYDIDDLGGSGVTLRAAERYLSEQGDDVWATNFAHTLGEIREWAPDLIIGQQWATEEASQWATLLRVPFVMMVRGTGQYEQFMPQCDLVVFNTNTQYELARHALGATPATVLYPPVVRADHATAGIGDWEHAVREALLDLDAHRQSALALAELRDPTEDLASLRTKLQRLVTAGRRKPTLSLCMTVANEAATLEKAIDSVAPFVDEIIIGVDGKSTDETSAIARRRATHYFEYVETSPPNFPRMRNRAMEMVNTDWAIVLDGHEWIEHPELIRPSLETTAWSIEIQTLYEPDENRVPSLAFPFPRIHRRHVRFEGAEAHEEVSTPLERRDLRTDIKVWHERKPGHASSIRSEQKAGAELDALRAAWIERGDRRALFYLANGLRDSGRYRDAIIAYEEYLRAPNFKEEGWQAMLYMARCFAAEREWGPARHLFEQAILACPERAEAAVGLGYVLLELGEPRAATAWFRMAASLPEPTHCRLFVEVPTYRWGAWHGLALALDRAGDHTAAAEAESRALAGGAGEWADENTQMWRRRSADRLEVLQSTDDGPMQYGKALAVDVSDSNRLLQSSAGVL